MTTLEETLLTESRDWISNITPLNESKIIAGAEGADAVPVPDKPFIHMMIDPLHQEDGVGEDIRWLNDGQGQVVRTIFKNYTASLLLTGYGLETSDYMLELKTQTASAPISVRSISDTQPIPEIPNDEHEREARFQQDFEISYRVKIEGPTVPELKTVKITGNFKSNVESDFSDTLQVQV